MAFLYCIVYITSVFIFFELHIAVRHGQHDIAPNPEPNPNFTSQYDKDNIILLQTLNLTLTPHRSIKRTT